MCKVLIAVLDTHLSGTYCYYYTNNTAAAATVTEEAPTETATRPTVTTRCEPRLLLPLRRTATAQHEPLLRLLTPTPVPTLPTWAPVLARAPFPTVLQDSPTSHERPALSRRLHLHSAPNPNSQVLLLGP